MKGKKHKKIKTTTPKKTTKIWQEHQDWNNEHKKQEAND